jgi:LAO/AO transport system kinase
VPQSDPSTLAEKVRSGDRTALARAITLAESTRAGDRGRAEKLLTELLPSAGKAIRIGISGAPGAGKSTYIEALGEHVTRAGKTLAVLAVDPSSRISGGSILGDKTRMPTLARNPRAFIRPTPAGMATGGVARRTREAMLLAEAAGYGIVLVETVGVGQAETDVADMVDLFVLLVGPGGGDDLQGIKRGAMELADLVVITKADGDLAGAAARALADHRAALSLMRPRHDDQAAQAMLTSARTGAGIAESWDALEALWRRRRGSGALAQFRREQTRTWFWSEIRTVLTESLAADPAIAHEAAKLEASVVNGLALPDAAARDLIRSFRRLDGAGGHP